MICLVLNNNIVVGPTAWGDQEITLALFRAGFIDTPDKPLLPAEEPTSAATLANGYAILPVTVEPDAPPSGQIVTGHVTTIANNVVTVAPVYGPAPPAPTPPPPSSQVAKVDFLKRFQDSELTAAKALEATDTNMGIFWEKFRAVTNYVDLTDTEITGAVNYLVTKQVLTQDRATAILTP
jgi:hypothetical protein